MLSMFEKKAIANVYHKDKVYAIWRIPIFYASIFLERKTATK